MSESFNGVDPGKKGRENTIFPTGTMTVDAMKSTLAEPNLFARRRKISEMCFGQYFSGAHIDGGIESRQFTHLRM
jgi:hypothetical protein